MKSSVVLRARARLKMVSLGCLLLLFIFDVSCADTRSQGLTLTEAIKRTLAHSPQLHQYSFLEEALKGQRSTARLAPPMQLGLMVENASGSGSLSGSKSSEVTVALSSVLQLGTQKQSRLTVVDAQVDILTHQKEVKSLDVLAQVTLEYIRLLKSQNLIRLAEEALALSAKTLSIVSDRAKRGGASEAEVMRATSALYQSEIHLKSLNHLYERQKVSLSYFWGARGGEFDFLSGSLFEFGSVDSFSDLYLRVQRSSVVQVFASERRLQRAQLALVREESKGGLSWQLGIKRYEDSGDAGVGFGVSMPLVSRKRHRGVIRSSIATRDRKQYLQSDMLALLHKNLFIAYSNRQQHVNAVSKMKEYVIPSLERVMKITQVSYENGQSNYQDWVAAQKELLVAKQSIIDSASFALINQTIMEQLTAEPIGKQRI